VEHQAILLVFASLPHSS